MLARVEGDTLCYVRWKLWKVVFDNAGAAAVGYAKTPRQNFGY